MANYYCLIAGLPDIDLADTQPGYSLDALREEMDQELTDGDRRLLDRYFWTRHDAPKMGDAELYGFLSTAIAECSNPTIKGWWQLTLDVNNYLTDALARRQGWDPALYVQGEGEVDAELAKELATIANESDPVRKEKMIDALRWLWLDEQTFYEPFAIDSVFAYLCKLEMQLRWANLDPKLGEETFKQIIENLRGEARVPDEFVRK